ncbi:MAG: preprotein translocase subunit SecD, partial [Gemmatimonadota bacterium]
MRAIRNRFLIIFGLLAMCIWSLIPKTGPEGEKIPAINLGLDLQGGMHLAVEIDDPDGTLTSETRADAIDRTLTTIRNRIDEFGVREPTIQRVGDERIIVELAGIEDPERAKAIVERTAFLQFMIVREDDNMREALPRLDRVIVQAIGAENLPAAAVEEEPAPALTQLLGEAGTDTLTAVEGDSAGVGGVPQDEQAGEVPDSTSGPGMAVDQEATLRPLTGLLLESGRPGMFLVAEENVPTVTRYIELPEFKEALPRNTTLAWGVTPQSTSGAAYRELYVLEAEPLVTGEYLADAGPATRDPQFNQPIVPFEMTRQGARIFERGTSRNVGRLMAIVLDGRVQSAPVIRQTLSRRAQIELGTGSAFQEAQDLALVLRAGALPMPIRIVEENTIGPSLGADSIRSGRNAFIIGIIGVVLIMLWYYRLAGLMAVLALGVYVVLVL